MSVNITFYVIYEFLFFRSSVYYKMWELLSQLLVPPQEKATWVISLDPIIDIIFLDFVGCIVIT